MSFFSSNFWWLIPAAVLIGVFNGNIRSFLAKTKLPTRTPPVSPPTPNQQGQGAQPPPAPAGARPANAPAQPAGPMSWPKAVVISVIVLTIGSVIADISETPPPIPDKVGEMVVDVGIKEVKIDLPLTNKAFYPANLTPDIKVHVFSKRPQRGWEKPILITEDPNKPSLPSINRGSIRFIAEKEGAKVKVIYYYR